MPGMEPNPDVRLICVGRRQGRWLPILAIGVVATAAIAFAKPWDGPAVVTTLPSANAPSLPAPTPRTTSSPSATVPFIGGQAWLLDFDRSGLSSIVCMGFAGSRCESRGRLGSSIRFEGDQIVGGTGVGGGCDLFTGHTDLRKLGLGFVVITIPSNASRCYDTGVDQTIRDRLNRVIYWHLQDRLLILLDSDETELLVYGPSS